MTDIGKYFLQLREQMRELTNSFENYYLQIEAMRIILSESHHPGREARLDELMTDPALVARAKEITAPMLATLEDNAILISLGLYEEENPSTGKPN